MNKQDCNPQKILICTKEREQTNIRPLPNFNVASSGKATVINDHQNLTGDEMAQVSRFAKVDYDMLKSESDQTQSLLQSEFDQTQVLLTATNTALNAINNNMTSLLEGMGLQLQTIIDLLQNVPNNVPPTP